MVYNPGSGNVTLQFVRGPQGFRCDAVAVVHDNEATGGLRERVEERVDLILAFRMDALRVDGTGDSLPAWSTFMAWALAGGEFTFYPNASLSDAYTCVSEDEGFAPEVKGPGVYGAAFSWRILPGVTTPAGPGVVYQRFYGIAS